MNPENQQKNSSSTASTNTNTTTSVAASGATANTGHLLVTTAKNSLVTSNTIGNKQLTSAIVVGPYNKSGYTMRIQNKLCANSNEQPHVTSLLAAHSYSSFTNASVITQHKNKNEIPMKIMENYV